MAMAYAEVKRSFPRLYEIADFGGQVYREKWSAFPVVQVSAQQAWVSTLIDMAVGRPQSPGMVTMFGRIPIEYPFSAIAVRGPDERCEGEPSW
jgi:hypothetical protein